jgi:hypothetical protein
MGNFNAAKLQLFSQTTQKNLSAHTNLHTERFIVTL